jgi:hypothetical protein
MPARIRALPRNKAGYPIPYFAADVDGERDFRVGDSHAYARCLRNRSCWVCGQRRTGVDAFVVGPMCVVNLITPDPPSHLECAEYAAKVCPFMAVPSMTRRDRGLPEGTGHPGVMIPRNPGVSAIVSTTAWTTFRPSVGGDFGVLFNLNDPTAVSWWAEGRTATRAEILASIESGLPLLREECDLEVYRLRARAHAELDRQRAKAERWLPTA